MIRNVSLWLYALFGRVVTLAWRYGWIKPGGNAWHEERVGWHPTREDNPLWLHAASLGEVAVARAYAEELANVAPLCLTVQTDSGNRAARETDRLWSVGYAPIDTVAAVTRFTERLRPRGLVLFETELWPVWLSTFRGPIWMANARLSEGSLRRLARFGHLLNPVWRHIQFVGAQSEGDARRFEHLGISANRIEVTGQIKQFLAAPEVDEHARQVGRERLGIADSESLWICGSVRPDETELILRLFGEAQSLGQRCRLVLAPRHLKHVSDTFVLAEKQGRAQLISQITSPDQTADVFILDTHGELASLYAAADLALVGGTFAPYGGHNPNEPARFGVPVVTGPFTRNIEGDLALLAEAGIAWRVESVEDVPRLAQAMQPFDGRAACARLGAILNRRTHPADRLAAQVAEQLASYASGR